MIRHRYRRIVLFFARILSGIIIWDLFLPRMGLRRLSQRTRPNRLRKAAVAFRELAVEMGGVMIKVGQFLSSRVDVLPPEITNELEGLQDEVPPVEFQAIRAEAEREYGRPLAEVFSEFEPHPLAAASLGQVHTAVLRQPCLSGQNGELEVCQVVVKIQRPDIESIIATDLAALRTVGNWLVRYRPIRQRADVPALLAEFSKTLYEEIDYLAEGRNAETFQANFKRTPGVYVPQVAWPFTTRRVLVLENVLAIKINDYQAITEAGISRPEVATRLLSTYLKQIFEDGFFHADPHPGNLFVTPQTGGSWQLTFVDFGMVGRVPDNLRMGLRELLIGVGTQDAQRVVESYQKMGILLPSADLELLKRAEAKAFERFWGKNMSELAQIELSELREFMGEFRELLYNLPFQVPSDMLFLARAVGILSGMCTGLDPDFNVWEELVPYAEKLISEEVRKGGQFLLDELGSLARAMISIPRKLDGMLGKLERGELAVRAPEVSRQVLQLERALRQLGWVIVFTALLISGVQVYLARPGWLANILLAGAGLSLILSLFASRHKT
jgi:predicted unusual protein kinase regulating ubiquinone biosynthesis (AarF/ABC1/UbiB family)